METRTLTAELADDYAALFERSFGDNPRWAGCWCAFYDDPCSDEDWDPSDPAFAERNRRNRLAAIRAGEVTGVLAYEDGRALGWVNAMLRRSYANLRIFDTTVGEDELEVGSIMCFVVPPEARGRGVATALLEAVDDHLRALGAEVVEAYPRAAAPDIPGFPWTAAYYKGTREMYERAGYREHRGGDRFAVMRKDLR